MPRQRIGGSSVIEVLVIAAVLAALIGIFIRPAGLADTRRARAACMENLKNIGLAARIFAVDHDNLMPGQVLLSRTPQPSQITIADYYRTFSNNLAGVPLWCPSEKRSRPEPSQANVESSNTSYFASLTASMTNAASFQAGDRNLLIDALPAQSGLSIMTRDKNIAWSHEIHNGMGNILASDGSVQIFRTEALRKGYESDRVGTNLWLFP